MGNHTVKISVLDENGNVVAEASSLESFDDGEGNDHDALVDKECWRRCSLMVSDWGNEDYKKLFDIVENGIEVFK